MLVAYTVVEYANMYTVFEVEVVQVLISSL